MRRPSFVLVVIGVLGAAFGLLSELVQASNGVSPERMLIDFAVGQAYLVGGLVAWARDPDNRSWRIMTALGWAWYVGNYAASTIPLLGTAAAVLADTDAVLLILLVLAYPTGRLEEHLHRAVVLVAAVGLTGANLLFVLTGSRAPALFLGLALTAALLILVPRRWLTATRELRRVLVPTVIAALVTLVTVGAAIVAQLVELDGATRAFILAARDVGVLAIPIGFIVGSFQLADERVRRSRARLIEATDLERRRLERDLHDGAQQRLVALSLALRHLRGMVEGTNQPALVADVDAAQDELRTALAELRELAHGIHPAVLTEAGLAGALPSLADRASVPATITAVPDRRLPPAVEATAYFVASEALANAAKHAEASMVSVEARVQGEELHLVVRDDGRGGANLAAGTGLTGLEDRVSALGGQLSVDSQRGHGTTLTARIPVTGAGSEAEELGLTPWTAARVPETIGADDHDAHRG